MAIEMAIDLRTTRGNEWEIFTGSSEGKEGRNDSGRGHEKGFKKQRRDG